MTPNSTHDSTMHDNADSDTDRIDEETKKILVIDEDDIVDAIFRYHREGERASPPLRVRWRTDENGTVRAKIGRYDTTMYTRSHLKIKPLAFSDDPYVPHRQIVVSDFADELDLDASTEDEIREEGFGDELDEWFDVTEEEARADIRRQLLRDVDELEKRIPGNFEFDEIVYE